MQAALDIILLKPGLFKDLRIRQEIDRCPAPLRLSDDRQKAVFKFQKGNASGIAVLIDIPVPGDGDRQFLGKGIDHTGADAVQASAGLVGAVVKFTAGVQGRKHHALRADSFFMHADRYPSPVIRDSTGTVSFKSDMDRVAEPGQMLVYGIIHDLIDQVVQSPCGNTADIHTGPGPDGFEPFQDTDALRTVLFIIWICHYVLLHLLIIRSHNYCKKCNSRSFFMHF